jgi:hypothetical protein
MLPVQLDGDMLASTEISTWMTDAGGFDVLPGLAGPNGQTVPYEDLVQRENVIDGEGFTIQSGGVGRHHHSQGARQSAQRPRSSPRAVRVTGCQLLTRSRRQVLAPFRLTTRPALSGRVTSLAAISSPPRLRQSARVEHGERLEGQSADSIPRSIPTISSLDVARRLLADQTLLKKSSLNRALATRYNSVSQSEMQ